MKCHHCGGSGVEPEPTLFAMSATTAPTRPRTRRTQRETDAAWREGLDHDPAYVGVDIERELAKARRWAATHGREPTRAYLENWLGRADRVVTTTGPGGAITRAWDGQPTGRVTL